MNKLNALTSLRFFAAFAIVVEHSRSAFSSMSWIGDFPYDYGVSFFFVLSGFILTCVYHNRIDTPRAVGLYYLARVARIWPSHIAALLLFVALIPAGAWFVGGPGPDALPVTLANIFMVQSWVPTVRYFFSFNAVSWSISTEMFFYLMFPILRHRWTQTWHWKTLLILLAISLILSVATARGLPDVDFANPSALSSSGIGYIWPVVRIIEFVLGMIAGSFYLGTIGRGPRDVIVWTIFEIAAMASVWTLHRLTAGLPSQLAGHQIGYSAWGVFVAHCGASIGFALVVLAIAYQRGAVSKIMNWKALVVLGNVSFALYLVHQTLLAFVLIHRSDMFANIPDEMLCALFWFASFATAFVLWRGVEEPCRRVMKRVGVRTEDKRNLAHTASVTPIKTDSY